MNQKIENTSGIVELAEYKVLLLPDPVEEKTAGGLYKPDTTKDREKYQTTKATYILGSANAFRDWGGYIPDPGDRILVNVHAGQLWKGDDGKEYRICNDKDVIGKINE
ncbi:MAG TPA: hypothetical protein VIY48_07685 [Candidatus Paceibacterota bacterium]